MLSHVQLFAILWTVAQKAPLSMGISSKNIEVGCCALLQGIFLTQGSNLNFLCLLHCRWILYPLSHWECSGDMTLCICQDSYICVPESVDYTVCKFYKRLIGYTISSVQFSQFSRSACPTLCYLMTCSKPGLPVHHQPPELTQTHVHRVSDAIQPSHSLSSPSPPYPNHSRHPGLF